jgi:hypothetical protein
MNFLKLFITTLIMMIALGNQPGFTKDRSYKFTINGHYSDQIKDQEDFARLKAAEYTLDKGYSHFIIENARRYSREARNSGTLGSRKSSKPQARTELSIHVYDQDPNLENSFNAATLMEQMNIKYSD